MKIRHSRPEGMFKMAGCEVQAQTLCFKNHANIPCTLHVPRRQKHRTASSYNGHAQSLKKKKKPSQVLYAASVSFQVWRGDILQGKIQELGQRRWKTTNYRWQETERVFLESWHHFTSSSRKFLIRTFTTSTEPPCTLKRRSMSQQLLKERPKNAGTDHRQRN